MSGLVSLILRVFRRWWPVPARKRTAPPTKQTVLCVGCVEDCTVLERVLGPGAYDVSFLASIDGAYSRILGEMPSKVIFCMRAADERSLQVLSMLNLDPRTNGIPIITCVPSVTAGDGGVEPAGADGFAPASSAVVMH